MDAIYSERGGFSIGKNRFMTMNVGWPLAKIYVCYDKIVFKALFCKKEFHKDEIIEIKRYQFMLSRGIQIVHRGKGTEFVVFYSMKPGNLLERIREAGYKVPEEVM